MLLLPVVDHIMEGENVAVAIADFILPRPWQWRQVLAGHRPTSQHSTAPASWPIGKALHAKANRSPHALRSRGRALGPRGAAAPTPPIPSLKPPGLSQHSSGLVHWSEGWDLLSLALDSIATIDHIIEGENVAIASC